MSITKEVDSTLFSEISFAFSFSLVFWIDASSVGTITQGLKGICNLPAAQSSGLDGSPESALHWIGSLKETYIIVFDNADVLSPADLEAYLPPGKGGNILITSRNATMRNLTSPENSVEVCEMEENDAITLLLKASYLDLCSVDFRAEASKIVKEFSCLPLAIDQAGAYIASGATTIGDYLEKYSEHRKTLLSHSEFTGASKYNRNVYGTWEFHTKKSRRGLNLMIHTEPVQLIVQCFCSIYFLSSIMRESLRKYFLMLPLKKMRKTLTLNCHLPALCWIGNYFLSIREVHGITLSLEREFEYYCHSP